MTKKTTTTKKPVATKKQIETSGNLIYDTIIVGGGPAGLAAAIAAKQNGLKNVLILERDNRLGGILLQCIHNGFGLHYFGEELTGPEYANRFVSQVEELGIESKVNTMVLEIQRGDDSAGNQIQSLHRVIAINSNDGLMMLQTRTIILCMGCRERTRGALVIPGTRPAGIFTAGSAQRFVNIDGYLPGKKVVILGSGDIGLIMARRLTLEGAEVKVVCEIMNYSAGLARNLTQCLENFDIPLKLSTTIIQIHGTDRVSGVTIAKVDEHRKPIPGTEEFIECDTVLLSVGLIPENEVSIAAGVALDSITSGPSVDQYMETSIPGIFACGNSVHVHDLVDFVTEESLLAGKSAAEYCKNPSYTAGNVTIPVLAGNRVRYAVPQHLDLMTGTGTAPATKSSASKQDSSSATSKTTSSSADAIRIMFRSTDVYRSVTASVYAGQQLLAQAKKRIVRPGEMQTIELKPAAIEQLRKSPQSITISIEMPEDSID
jgi:thioredoxin reductase